MELCAGFFWRCDGSGDVTRGEQQAQMLCHGHAARGELALGVDECKMCAYT